MIELEHIREADAEMRYVLGRPQAVSVVCHVCQTSTRFELGNGVPVAPCPRCGTKLTLRTVGRFPEVTSR
jgi:uncharacterized paraquat-inducible protein A